MVDSPTTAVDRSLRGTLTRFGASLLWIVMPFVAGPAFADALVDRSRPVQLVLSTGLWMVWAAALLALLVPRTVSLTVCRIIVPASVPAAFAALLAAPTIGATQLVAVFAALATTIVVLAPSTGHVMVNGSSYGDERRFPLRAPAALLLGPIELAWVVCVAGAVSGPWLLAAQAWFAGGAALLVGWPACFVAARALHGLARRWIVFVPAGFVLHDQMAVADPVLMPRKLVRSIGPALADTTATDFTLGSMGLALQVDLHEPLTVAPLPRRTAPGQRPALESVDVDALLFTPTRPGALLHEARARRLPVG